MLSFLKNHPFAIEAFFESSVILTFAVLKEQLQQFIPECLQLDTFKDKWAFIAIAMVQTTDLRPKGFPKSFGNDFFLAGYRVFVQYNSNAGKRLRGLYILKSETDKKKMEFLGNIFTHYNYSTTDIIQTSINDTTEIKSVQSDFKIVFKNAGRPVDLPVGSPFTDWKDARKFAGPLPFTFTYDALKKKVLIIEGVRQNWTPVPLEVTGYYFSFLNNPAFNGALLANAFIIHNIPYYWKKGKTEQWTR